MPRATTCAGRERAASWQNYGNTAQRLEKAPASAHLCRAWAPGRWGLVVDGVTFSLFLYTPRHVGRHRSRRPVRLRAQIRGAHGALPNGKTQLLLCMLFRFSERITQSDKNSVTIGRLLHITSLHRRYPG